MKYILSVSRPLRTLVAAALAALAIILPCSASAFSPTVYAPESRLASGRWVRITVAEEGLYRITPSELRRLGFSDPSRVRVYGYGGERIPDCLSEEEYVDDLVIAPCAVSVSSGIVFWARGLVSWKESTIARGRYLHSLNPYALEASYFLGEIDQDVDGDEAAIPSDGEARFETGAADSFIATLWHEQEITSPGQSGHMLVGEEFRSVKSRTFRFPLVDVADFRSGYIESRFIANTPAEAFFSVSASGETVGSQTKIRISPTSSSAYASAAMARGTFSLPESSSLEVQVTFEGGSDVKGAWLDYITLNYRRRISLHEGLLAFSVGHPAVVLETPSPESTVVWDITDRKAPFVVNTVKNGDSGLAWVNPYAGMRRYVAWSDKARTGEVKVAETVDPQNIHGEPVPDMIVVAPADWIRQAERLADYHRQSPDSLRVLVVSDRQAYNEFSSGTPDVGAFRRMFKMFYDRGADSAGHRLRYALLMGRAIFDNRGITPEVKQLGQLSLPCWQTDDGLRESNSYMTDDFLCFLADDSGVRLSADRFDIAVGRLPVGTVAEARSAVDKLLGFYSAQSSGSSRRSGKWKNHVLLTADDGDNGIHMTQAETQFGFMGESDGGSDMLYSKVYIDAYDEEGGLSVIGRRKMHAALEEGVAWWNYIGHGNTQRLGSEGLIVYNDLLEMQSPNPAFFYAATCSFMRWEGTEKSACELLFHNPQGGVIGAICPTREVYISDNEYMSNSVGRNAFRRDSDGRYPTVGEIFRRSKNDLVDRNGNPIAENSNKLRFSLMADPAMRLVVPDCRAVVESINGLDPADPQVQLTVMARQKVKVEGAVYDPSGRELLDDFSGTVEIELYDAEKSVTTQGRPSDDTSGERVTYEEQGSLLYAGRDSVASGRFSIEFAMPQEIADNFRPAAINIYARASDLREAVGVERRLYVYGYDDTAEADTIAPVIEYAYLNHASFTNGDVVNPSPMFIASVSDDTGINLSAAGIGHQMTLKIDDRDTFTDLSTYYTPAADGSIGGTVAYPLSGLGEGQHMLSFRVWDTSGNSALHTFSFSVSEGLAPQMFDVYTDANPAIDHADFYISHNRPDQRLTVTIEVFNLAGVLQWSSTTTEMSDLFLSAPVRWNLCDNAGRRVPRGIYIYRAVIESDGTTSKSMSKRIAVAES